MIKITYRHLNSTPIEATVDALAAKPLPVKTAYYLGRILKVLKKEIATAKNIYAGLLHKYAEFDENGVKTDGFHPILKEGCKEAYEKEFTEFLSIEFEVPFNKLDMEALSTLELTPTQMLALEPMLDIEDTAA
jgi:hypothetical protein